MLRGGTIYGNAVRMPNSWSAVVKCTLLLFCCMQAYAQLMLSESSRWSEWNEENSPSVNGRWTVHNLSSLPELNRSSFTGGEVVLLNTSCCVDSSGSGNGDNREFYFSLIGPSFMITSNCTVNISYLLLTSEPFEGFVRLTDGTDQLLNNLTNMSNSVQVSLSANASNTSAQLVFNVMILDNSNVMLLIDDVSECVNVDPSLSTTMSPSTMSNMPFMSTASSTVNMSSTITSETSTVTSTSQSITPVTNTTSVTVTPVSTSSTFSTIPAITSLTTTTVATATSVIDSIPFMSSTTNIPTTSTPIMFSMTTTTLVLATSSPAMTSTPVIISTGNVGSNDDAFFSTTVIIAIAAGGGVLLLILLLLLCCCVCYRVRVSRQNHQKYYISNASNFDHHHKTGHSSHSSVFAQDRYRNKSRSAESVTSSPYMYELSHVHVETGPANYRHTNGDEDTIDSDNEDIRHDLKGTPISSRKGSYSASEHKTVNSHSRSNGRPYLTHAYSDTYSDDNQYSDDNLSKTSEISDATVYPNRNLLSEMCGGELPPILSLGDHEDDDDIVINNPYYVEPKSDEVSPKRSRKRSIDLEALTTLESSGEYDHHPKQPVYKQRFGAPPSASKNHKLLRKTKSELNLEDATKIVRNSRHHHSHKHQSKSRIDLREATKLGQSDLAKVSYHHGSLAREPHYSSSPKILDSRESSSRESSSKLERLTSLT